MGRHVGGRLNNSWRAPRLGMLYGPAASLQTLQPACTVQEHTNLQCLPMHHTVPEGSSAQFRPLPALTWRNVRPPPTSLGSSNDPMSSPFAGDIPQQNSLPSIASAQVWALPAAMAVKSWSVETNTGVVSVRLPLGPSCMDVSSCTQKQMDSQHEAGG